MCCQVVAGMSWRAGKTSSQRGYSSRWRKARDGFLKTNPLCAYCQKQGRVEPATAVDHIKPHKGDRALFLDKANWQPLCKQCHDSVKQRKEHGRPVVAYDLDGYPIE